MTNSTAPTHGETGAPSLSRGRTSASGGAFAALADTVAIVVFATIGRASHEHGMSVAGVAQTAAPSSSARPWGGSPASRCDDAPR